MTLARLLCDLLAAWLLACAVGVGFGLGDTWSAGRTRLRP